jgi:hypothetical protein
MQRQYQHVSRQLTRDGLVSNCWYIRRQGHTAKKPGTNPKSASPAIPGPAKLKSVIDARYTESTTFIDIHESLKW